GVARRGFRRLRADVSEPYGDVVLGGRPGVGGTRGRDWPSLAATRSGDGDLTAAVMVCHAGQNSLGALRLGRCGPHGIAQHMTRGRSSGSANRNKKPEIWGAREARRPGGQLMPVVEAERDRGSRECQAPRATLARKVSTTRLKTSGSSRLAVWPVRGRTA